LQSYTADPGALDIDITGAGFAPAESIAVYVSRRGAPARAELRADGSGRVLGTIPLHIAPLAAGPLQFVALGEQSHRKAIATFIVLPYVPVLHLEPAAAPPGGTIRVSGRGFAPNEAVRVRVNGRVVRQTRADAGGGLQLQPGYSIPFTAPAGRFTLTVVGELSGHSAVQRGYVLPLRPWVTASAYVVHTGERVQFDAHGFAPDEIVKVYAQRGEVGQSNAPTDGQGNAGGIGPVPVPTTTDAPAFLFVGARSGASTTVRLTRVR
jgi:hypothetical protein